MSVRRTRESRPERPRHGGQTPVRRYRKKMRRLGMRLVQFWAPDTNAPGFGEECRRQSMLAVADKRGESQILDEIGMLSADLDLGASPDFVMPRDKKK